MTEQIKTYLGLFLEQWKEPYIRAIIIFALSFLMAMLIKFIVLRLAKMVTQKTKTDIDDTLIATLEKPIFWSVLIIGIGSALGELEFSEQVAYVVYGLLKSTAVIIWGMAAMRIGSVILKILSNLQDKVEFIQNSTLPMFEIVLKLIILGAIVYFAFISWGIDLRGWLASAGIVGIAVGFAAKDTLANLFAGVFILTDSPYQIGDFIVLPKGERGQVTQIGIRSTRILTRDDIEITIPNANIANSQIVNETSGRHEKRRVVIIFSVAYGSDVSEVRQIVLDAVKDAENICKTPSPRVQFTLLDDSGLQFKLKTWIRTPVLQGRATDELNTRIYNALNANNIEIPYPKQDLYIKEFAGK